MAIKMIENDGQIFYRVRVVKRSSQDPSLCAIRCVNEIKSFSEAQKIERKLIAQTERALLEKEHQCAKWETLIKEWQEATLKGDIFTRELTQGTVKDYVRLLTDHTKNWLNLPTTEITKAMAWQAMDAIEREISVTRRKKLRSAIDAVFSWAYLAGKIKGEKSIPTEGYKSTRKEEEKMPEILSIEEIRILLKTARDMNHEWYHIWALALLTGMRSGELYALKWKKVDFDAQLIYVQDAWTNKRGFGPTKARYWRTVPIGGSELEKLLKELKLVTGKTEFVLPRKQEWTDGRQADELRQFCKGIGIPSVRFHTLRACFATQLIKDGVAPAIVMKICGWKDLKTMQRYIRLAGIEVQGATQGLKFLPEEQVIGRVVEMFGVT